MNSKKRFWFAAAMLGSALYLPQVTLSADKSDTMKNDKAGMMKDAKGNMRKDEKSKQAKDKMMKDGMKMEEKSKAKTGDSKMMDEKKK